MEISEESREITTFITKKGLFRYTRLMFGIVCAPEVFQRIMEMILSGCGNCYNYMDDIVIYGRTEEELKINEKIVLDRLKEYDVVLNEDKCIYRVRTIVFLGHTLSGSGITTTNDKINSIMMFRQPKTMEEVRSFLGLVTYVGKFIPDLATTTEPLRNLTKKDACFVWKQEHDLAFEQLKSQLTGPMVLGYYSVTDRTQLYADASPVGLGAVLVQFKNSEPRIISYASKSLSETEKRYCQTEKEALALVWAVERFHFYLYGRNFELITDHKPLEVIFSPKSKPCARIERWVLRLQSYRFKVIHKAGKNNIADPLSRLVAFEPTNISFDEINEEYVYAVLTFSAPVAIKLSEIKAHSEDDETIAAVRNALDTGIWSECTKPFKPFETELCFVDNILLRSNKIVMPEKLRTRTLELAHEGHPGIAKMKQRLRIKVWWPKIDVDAEAYVKKCHGCTMVSAPPPPEPLRRKELPSKPWQHIAIDFLGPLPSGDTLFVIVDYYSRYIEVEIMRKTDASVTISRLEKIFARFGNPESITADNGPPFNSNEFKRFCVENNIDLVNTIPHWPQQNGEVERQNRSLVKRLKISQNEKRDWKKDLLTYLIMYRSTPHSTTQKTPSELLFGRTIRDKLPSMEQSIPTDDEVRDNDKLSKEKGKEYADRKRHAKPSEIGIGDIVWLKQFEKTNKLTPTFIPIPHKVIEKKGSELVVEGVDSSVRYRRNVAHVVKAVSTVRRVKDILI